ncbi:lytic transglycosylase, catalytic [Candidatus Moduliflexus flocculans]|uniref:Lytic transglycosylase, catalytic n=1 Tax=Candidatus Moduliflexus flocculans TaxID=1499966 RepID=A0A081BRU9_9BACT|nr:lytic transglycosylase, catalytic [Candidatus Moduliflexus flocculans]
MIIVKKSSVLRIVAVLLLFTFLPMSALTAAPRSLAEKRVRFAEGIAQLDQKAFLQAVQTFQTLASDYRELPDYTRFFLAKAYVGAKQYQDALTELQAFRAAFPNHPLQDDVLWLMANALVELKREADALPLYQELVARPSNIAKGDLLYKIGVTAAALNQSQIAVEAFQALLTTVPAYVQAKDAQTRLQAILTAHPELTPVMSEDAQLNYANTLLVAKLYAAAIAQYQAFLQRYPASPRLPEAQIALVDATLRAGKQKEGTDMVATLVKQFGTTNPEIAAKALYTLGAAHWNADRNDEAQRVMERIITQFNATTSRENALYVSGRIAQSNSSYLAAAKFYRALAEQYPNGAFAEEAFWRAGWSYYQAQDYLQAAQMFSQGLTAFPANSYSEDGQYWLGRAHEGANATSEAVRVYQQLLQYSPYGYYALQAKERLALLRQPTPQPPTRQGTSPELSDVVKQTGTFLPPEVLQALPPHVNTAIELRAVNQIEYARREITWLQAKADQTPPPDEQTRLLRLYLFSRLYAQIGDYLTGIQLATPIESALRKGTAAPFPYDLTRLLYPLEYWELITTYAAQNSLDPFFVAGIIRQESAFNPKALSSANARGLMQVIPETGRRVAKRIGLKNYTTAQLYDPAVNIQIGTAYIAELLKRFQGNQFRAIAAYNAGPQNTDKWWPAQGAYQNEEIVENISFRATKSYVKQVLRNQANYREFYPEYR